MYIGLDLKYLLFLSDFSRNLIFSTDFWKMLKYEILWKSARVFPCGHSDGGTDRHDEAHSRFRNFANATKIRDPDDHVPICTQQQRSYANGLPKI